MKYERSITKKLGILLITILMSSMFISTIFIVNADVGGTGKYLTINFVDTGYSNCYVNATKVSSGQVFTFLANDTNTYSQKVGAGDVLLEGISDEVNGRIFSHFEGDGIIENEDGSITYKPIKYGEVEAIFERPSYTVVATINSGEGDIYINGVLQTEYEVYINVYHGESTPTIEFVPFEGYEISNVYTNNGPITSPPPYILGPITEHGNWIKVDFALKTYNFEVYVASGEGQILFEGVPIETNPAIIAVNHGSIPTFQFITETPWHLSSVLVDGTNYVNLVDTDFTTGYQFDSPIYEDGHSLVITFSEDGRAVITEGLDVTVFLSSAASLTFYDVGEGYALGNKFTIPALGDIVTWDITVIAELGDQVVIGLVYNNLDNDDLENALRMYRVDVEDFDLYLRCDINDDGVVNGQDVRIVSKLSKLPKFQLENPELAVRCNFYEDYTTDGLPIIDENDIHIVNSMNNIKMVDITLEVDTANNIIYGITDHFSIFRCR